MRTKFALPSMLQSSYDIATANGKGGKEIRAPEIIGLRLNQRLKLKLQQPTDAF